MLTALSLMVPYIGCVGLSKGLPCSIGLWRARCTLVGCHQRVVRIKWS